MFKVSPYFIKLQVSFRLQLSDKTLSGSLECSALIQSHQRNNWILAFPLEERLCRTLYKAAVEADLEDRADTKLGVSSTVRARQQLSDVQRLGGGLFLIDRFQM